MLTIPTIAFHIFLSFVSRFKLSLAIVEGQAIGVSQDDVTEFAAHAVVGKRRWS